MSKALVVAVLVLCAQPAVAHAQEIYGEVLGGITLPTNLYYYDPGTLTPDADPFDPLPAGGAIAAALGIETGIAGLSAELGGFFVDRTYEGGDYELSIASVMASAKYTVPVGELFSIYGAAGLGGVLYFDRSGPNGGADIYAQTIAPGYQLQAGVSARIGDGVRLLGEYRLIGSFVPATGTAFAGVDEQTTTSAFLIGLHFSH